MGGDSGSLGADDKAVRYRDDSHKGAKHTVHSDFILKGAENWASKVKTRMKERSTWQSQPWHTCPFP